MPCHFYLFLHQQRAIPEKKTNREKGEGKGQGGGGALGFTSFLKTPPFEFLHFLLYPWKFQTKQGFTPRNSTKLCYAPWKF